MQNFEYLKGFLSHAGVYEVLYLMKAETVFLNPAASMSGCFTLGLLKSNSKYQEMVSGRMHAGNRSV